MFLIALSLASCLVGCKAEPLLGTWSTNSGSISVTLREGGSIKRFFIQGGTVSSPSFLERNGALYIQYYHDIGMVEETSVCKSSSDKDTYATLSGLLSALVSGNKMYIKGQALSKR